MQNRHKILQATFAVGLLIGIAGLVYWVGKSFFTYISAVPKELATALVAGTVTVLVATLTVVLGRYFERKRELDALYRDKKTQVYDEFLKKFFNLFWSESKKHPASKSDDLVPFLRDFMRQLLLWSGPEAIESFLLWKEHLEKGAADAQTIFLTEEFLLALRKDLRHSNRGIRQGFFAKLFLSDSKLFLELAKERPFITLLEVSAEVEKRKKGGSLGKNS